MTALVLAVAAALGAATSPTAMTGGTTVTPATIDVRVLTKEHPTQLTFEGPRQGAATFTGGELQVNGVTVSIPFALPSAVWRVRVSGRPPRTYDGAITLTADGRELAVVVRMERERYVALTVASETTPGTPPAALEAQAIVARSWAAATPLRHVDAEVCDLAHCQVIRSSVSPAHLAAAQRATLATRGVVLVLASGEVAMAPFHAACGGRTADPSEVFGGENHSGAESVEDPGCDGPRWRAVVSRDVVERAASETLRGGSGEPQHAVRLADLEITAGRGGWMRALVDTANGNSAFGDAFVRALGRAVGWGVVRGGRFRFTSGATQDVVIDGVGLGHGVGLCQNGAARLANAGETAPEILRHYFPRAILVTRAIVEQAELAKIRSLESVTHPVSR